METPRTILYNLVRPALRLALQIYFRRVETTDPHHLPGRGPVLLAANHPQSITDALVLSGSIPRVVHYLAHSGLFKNRVQAAVLRGFGVIPVVRREDDPQRAAEANEDAFAACFASLQRGEVVAIFPEGISVEERRLQPLRTGAARIALEAEHQNDFQLGVAVVPVGISFQSRGRFRSRVLLRFGKPIQAERYAEKYKNQPREAVARLTDHLGRAMRALVVNVEDAEQDRMVTQIERIYREDLLNNPDLELPGPSDFARQTAASQEIAQAVAWFRRHDPHAVGRLEERIEGYQETRRRWQLTDEMVARGEAPSLRRRALSMLAIGALGLPLAVAGAVANAVPYTLTAFAVDRLNPDPTKRHSHQFILGTALAILYYPALFWMMKRHWDLPSGRLFLIALGIIPAGLFARFFVRRWRRERRFLRFAWVGATQRAALGNLRHLRAEVLSDLDGLLQRYLTERGLPRRR
ncbi:MAG: hypothetical protein HKO53_11235 [Gemmatimonadetes bacterium]|nr:hypothetical protein [Gemmatimonadota bacterium]